MTLTGWWRVISGDLALGDNTLQITVSDGTVSRVYTVTVRNVDADVLSDDATLSALSVDGAAGHQVALAVGPNRVRVAVDAADGRGRAEYTLTIGRSGSPFARMPSLDLGMTLGSRSVALWSERSTVWTSLPQWDILAAFSLSGGKHRSRSPTRDPRTPTVLVQRRGRYGESGYANSLRGAGRALRRESGRVALL